MGLFTSADAFQVTDVAGNRDGFDRLVSSLKERYEIDISINNIHIYHEMSINIRLFIEHAGLARFGIFLDEELPRKSRNQHVWKVFSPLVDSGVIAAIRFSKPPFFSAALYGTEIHLYGQRDLVEWLARNESTHDSIFRRDSLGNMKIVSLTIRNANDLRKV